ncbi:MAG: type II toxin-antitoxin system prevent-host-death family antitoxin [Actinomycetota bacterium]|nr:type II toxin-antitoxin system prevent-host-death family antitoxin [Actinomycetota bacterium]MDK1016261.1 type II toxin-antitoxin system prevent-host-death family antitoxin [Actinomycetota bacterium]MDK1026017.1 type II toxin-antitoxin system prevent-host-death family antitoxin [Actinomycetota bacterium]MDK1037871.1 type II toxin-antitoxin system prevent-host-death family antitoxin [Actinomycetota bacterium]MDK1096888.1 type II toxin-antitoxin system prevent-host-death family antitoxin [Acti
MGEVASRELRNNTRELLDRVASGEDITITIDGRSVARLIPLEYRSRWMATGELLRRLEGRRADAPLTEELRELLPGTTDDVRL